MLGHNPKDLFTNKWMIQHSKKNSRWRFSAERIVSDLYKIFEPCSVLDIGCGAGNFSNYFIHLGCDVTAVDGSPFSKNYLAEKVMWKEHDLRVELQLNKIFDLVLCLEVAEHLDESYADLLLQSITNHANKNSIIVFCAARLNQGGLGHVNEQSPGYWIDKFSNIGYCIIKRQLTNRLKKHWRIDYVNRCYWRNIILFGTP